MGSFLEVELSQESNLRQVGREFFLIKVKALRSFNMDPGACAYYPDSQGFFRKTGKIDKLLLVAALVLGKSMKQIKICKLIANKCLRMRNLEIKNR
jgi:hypothetical protein